MLSSFVMVLRLITRQSIRSISRSNHGQNMIGILREAFPVFLHFIGQFEEEFPALIIPFEKWREEYLPLGQIAGELPGVTVGCGSLEPVFLVHKTGYGFMQRHILRGKIVIIPVVRIEIF